MKRKIISIFIVMVLMIGTVSGIALANDNNVAVIYAENVQVDAGEQVIIPICVKDNAGMAGFRIILEYDATVFEPVKVSTGELTSVGMISDSITSENTGKVDVVWFHNSNISDDGCLFNIVLSVSNEVVTGDYTISLSYQPDDTATEDGLDVELQCEDFVINVQGLAIEEQESTEPVEETTEESTETVEESTEAVEETTEESTGAVEETTEAVEEITEESTEVVEETTEESIAVTEGTTQENIIESEHSTTENTLEAVQSTISSENIEDTTVNTGDSTNVAVLLTVMLLSGIIVISIYTNNSKAKR